MTSYLKRVYQNYNFRYLKSHPLLWIYSAYLTIRYVDKYYTFPAIWFNRFVKVKIHKGANSKLIIIKKLIFESFIHGESPTIIQIANKGSIIIEEEFILGDGIKINVCTNAILKIKGKDKESASGITGNSVIMVMKYLEFGKDALCAWDLFITDCDWHAIDNKKAVSPTIIGDHVWIGIGAKILKGVEIGTNSIVASNSVVLHGSYPENSLLSGIPARVVKLNIGRWCRDLRSVNLS